MGFRGFMVSRVSWVSEVSSLGLGLGQGLGLGLGSGLGLGLGSGQKTIREIRGEFSLLKFRMFHIYPYIRRSRNVGHQVTCET